MTACVTCPPLKSLYNTLKLPFYTHFPIYLHRNLRRRDAARKNEHPRLRRCQETLYLMLCSEPLGKKARLMFAAVTQALLYTKHVRRETETSWLQGCSNQLFASQGSKRIGLFPFAASLLVLLSLENSGRAN